VEAQAEWHRSSRTGCLQKGSQKVRVQLRAEAVGGVMDLVHVLPPDVPQEGAQGPLSGAAGGAQMVFKGVAVMGEGVQGPEGYEGVPDVCAPEPGAGGGGDCSGDDRAQVAEFRKEYCKEGGQIVSRA
jgi:hypothetical protein